jgi:hypothetical protein
MSQQQTQNNNSCFYAPTGSVNTFNQNTNSQQEELGGAKVIITTRDFSHFVLRYHFQFEFGKKSKYSVFIYFQTSLKERKKRRIDGCIFFK